MAKKQKIDTVTGEKAPVGKPINELVEDMYNDPQYNHDTTRNLQIPDIGITDLDASHGYRQQGWDDKYKEYINPAILKSGNYSMEQLNQYRAQNQTRWEQTGNAFKRLGVNIVPQIMGGFASMLDIQGYWDAEHAANNQLVNWAADIKEQSSEDFGIYEENPDEFMQMGDFAWWASRGEGLVESVGAFLAQGFGVAKGVSLGLKTIPKLLQGQKLARAVLGGGAKGAEASKRLLKAGETLMTATMLNQSEAVLEATGVYREIKQDRLDKGYSIEEAKEAAGAAAATTMNINRINILLNLTSAHAFLQPMKFSSKIIKAPSKLNAAGKILGEAGQEGVEELINLVAEKAGKATGLGQEYGFNDALEDIQTMEGFEAAFLGAIGGMAQTGGTTALQYSKYGPGSVKDKDGNRISANQQTKNRYAQQQEVIKEMEAKGVNVSEALFDIKQQIGWENKRQAAIRTLNDPNSSEKDQEDAQTILKETQEQMFENQVLKAFESGTTQKLVDLYNSIKEADPLEMKDKHGKDYKQKVDQIVKDIGALEDVYNNHEDLANVSEIFHNRANTIRINRLKDNYTELKSEADNNLRDAANQISKKYKDSNGNSPVYSLDNLGQGPIEGATAEDKKMYEDFIKEVESTNTYKVQQDYAERLDEVENETVKNQEEFDTITSKKYQKEFIKKEEAKARQKEILSNIEATDSIAKLENMLSEYPDNEEIKNSINKKIDSIKTAEKEAAQLKKKETLKQNFKNQITSATSPDALLALRNEFEKSDILSGEDKEELSNLTTSKATALAGGTPVNPIPGAGNVATENVNNTDEQNDIERGKVAPEYESNNEETERVEAEKSQTISEVANEGKSKGTTVDNKVITYERTQAEDGPNSAASLSKNYNQIDENDTLSREEVSNEIISSTPLKILLNPNNLLPSTKVTFSVDENYSGPVYKSDSTTKETVEWQARLQEIKASVKEGEDYKASPEYLNEVPIKAVDNNGDLVFYMHDTAWINGQNLEGSEIKLDIARESLVLLRTHVITKGEWTTEIESRSPGVLLRTKNNENFPVSEVMPDENLVLGIGTSDGDNTFVTNGKPIEGTITGKNPRNGGAYAIVRLAKGKSVAIPLSRMSLSKQVANTMYKAIEAHLAAGDEYNTDNPIVNAIFEATKSSPGAEDGINIASINGLREYLKQFTYLFPVEKGVTLENILTSSTKKFTSDNGIIAVTGNNIQFGKPGVNIGGATKAITLSQNFKSNANGLLQLKDFLFDSKKQISSLKTNASKQHLKADKPVVLLNDDNTTNTISSYSEFVKTQFQTNIFSANIGTDENPDWIYTIQPAIHFSTEGVELPVLPAKPKPVATPTQQTTKEGKVVPLGKYKFTVMPNGEVISNATGKPIKQDGQNAEKARKLAAEQKPTAPTTEVTEDGPGNVSEDAQFEAIVVDSMKKGKEWVEESLEELRKELDASPNDPTLLAYLKYITEALRRLNAQEDVALPTKRKIGDLTVEDVDEDGDEYDEFTPEIEDLEGESVNIIEGISTEEQNSLVGFLSQKIIEEAENERVEGKEGPISVKPIFNRLRKDLEGVKSYYEEKGLKRKLEKVNKVLDQFEKLQEITAEYLSVLKTGRVSEASADENEGILERTSFSDDFNFTLDSKTTASAQLRQFFGFTHYDVENTNSVGLPAVVDFDTVYNTLHEILANQPSDYNTMLQVMEDYSDAFPWMQDIIKKLEEADESIQNEFVSDMAKHAITMRFVLWQKNSDGTYKLLDQNANSSSIQKRIMAIWNSNLKGIGTQSNLISIDAKSGEYIYNQDEANKLIDQAKEWGKLTKEEIKEIPFEDLSTWLGNFGIVLSDNTYRDLKAGRLYNNGKLYYNEVIKSNKGPIQALASELNKAIAGKVILTGSEADLLRDSAVRALAKLEAKNSYNTYSNSFNAGGKTVYTYTNNKYLTNRVRDLLSDDQKLLKELKEISFTKDSLWLNELLSDDGTSLDPTIKTTLGIDYLSLEALKQLFSPSKDNRKLNNLTAAEQELIKVALFQHNSTVKNGRRKASFFYPTMSDKSTMMIVNALAYNLNFENTKNITIDKEATDLLFNALVLPEINRINAAKKDSNIDGYEPSYFYFLPALNTLEISVAGVVKTVRDHAIDNLENVTSEEARTQIGTELKNIFKTLVEEKLEDWENLGIGQFNDQSKFDFLNGEYMKKIASDKAKGKDTKVIYAAADYVFNNLIANSETFKLFIGDPAQYAKKITTNEDGTINLDETFVNIGKRLAGDIAPGMELANSEDNTYFQLFLNDPKFSSKNIEFIESLHKKGLLTKEDLKAYKAINNKDGIEATDAQEYTTWQEHLYVMKQLGRLTRKEYDRVYKLLNTGKKLSDADLGLVFQPMKPVYVGNKVSKENNIDRRFYIKSSSFPLLPQLTAGLEIDKIREALEQFQRDSGEKNSDGVPTTVRASFSSANKVGGAKNGIEVFDADGNVNINIDNINPTQYVRLNRKDFRIQQDVPYKETKFKVNIGTQERKLLFLNILDVDGFSYKGKNYKGKELKAIYDNLYKEIFKNSYDKFLEEYGIDVEGSVEAGYQVPVSKIKDILVKEIRSREGYPLNMLSSLELNEAGDDFVIPLWASPYAKKFESLLTAAVSNNIVKQKFPGHSYVLGAEEGFKLKQGEEATEDLKNSSIVFTKNYDKEQGLLPMRKDPKTGKMLPAQIMIPFKFRDEEGNLMSASRFIGEDGLLDTTRIPEKVLQLWGFRIPTQGPNSMAAIEVVGFLPKSSGDLILAPRDFIAQMGSDFDVDKLYTYMYNTYFEDGKVKYDFLSNQDTINKELKKVETEIEAIKEELNLSEENLELLNRDIDRKIEYLNNNKLTREEDKKKASDILGKGFRIQADLEFKESAINSRLNNAIRKKARLKKSYVASRQNDIIEIHASIMANSADEVLRGMYKPDSFGDLGTIADRINKLKQKPVTTILSDTYQRTKFINGTAGKAGTGVFSLDSTFNAMAQDQNLVYFIPSEPMATDGLSNKELLTANSFSIKFGKALSKGDLSNKNTLVGNKLKSDVITALQSASVDNEKAQILDKLNINGETFEVVKALALLGFDSKDIAGLLTQPIIIEYVEMLRTAKSSLSEYNADAETLVKNALEDKYNLVENINNLNDDQLLVVVNRVDSLSGEDLLKLNEDPNNVLEEGKVSDYAVNQLLLLVKFLRLNQVGKDIRTVQSAINTESKGIESSLLGVKNKVTQINSLPTSNSIVNATNLLGDFKEGLFTTPTTVSGFASYYGTMLANTIYNKYFPYNRLGYREQIADIINHYKIDNGELTPSQELELEKEVFENMKSFFYSNIDLGLFTENAQKERKRLFIDTENNQSLATIITNFSNKKWFTSNAFLNKLTTDLNSNGNISRVFYEAASGENLDERPVYTGFQKLFNDNKLLTGDGPDGKINGRNYTTRNLAQDLVLYAFLEGGAQKARQFIKYIPTAYLKATNFGPVLSNTTFSYETNFGGLAEEIYQQAWGKKYKNPSKFTRQYFQNYPQNAHQFNLGQVTGEVKNVNNLKQFSPNNAAFRLKSEGGLVVKVNKDDGQKLFTKYVSIKDPSVPAGFALFEFDYSGPPMYKRIVTTADQYNFKQYDYSKDINIPLQRRNDFPGKQIIYASNTKTITAQNSSKDRVDNKEFNPNIADNTAQIQTIGPIKTDKKKSALEKFNDIIFQLETSEDVSDYNKKLIEEFKKVGFPEDLKLNIISDPNKGIGSWNSIKNTLTLNTSKLKDVSMDRMATVILHEMTHTFTSPLINSWVNKDFKSLTNEQKGTIAKLDGLRIKYIKNLENNGKLEELNSFYKTYLDSRLKNGTLSQKAYDKRLANWSNTISDQFTGTGKFTKEEISEFYGAINTNEFVAMAFTDAAFQKKLNDINDSDGAPFWNKITKLLTQLLKSLGIDVQPNSLLATALEETMSLINSNNNTVKTEFTDGKPEFAVDPNVAFRVGDTVEYKGEQGIVEQVKDSKQANNIKVRFSNPNRALEIKPSNLTYISSSTSATTPAGKIETISPDYGVVQVETNPTEQKTKEIIDALKPQAETQTFKENKGRNANMMFHYGLRWGRRKGNPSMGIGPMKAPIKNNPADSGTYYGYDLYDQNGNSLPPISDLQPVINEIQNSLGLDMSNYDSVIGNIYLPGEYVYPHRDTTESKSAEGYPVVVYTIGNDAGLGIWDGNKGKKTFANTYDSTYAPGTLANNNPTNEVLTKNGTIYTFGMEGKGRFNLVHTTPDVTEKPKKYPPITLPNGKTVTNYTITLTFRRAANLEAGMPSKPASATTQPAKITSMSEITNHSGGAQGGDTAWDKIGREYGVVNHNHYREPGATELDSPGLKNIKPVNVSQKDYDEGQKKVTIAARQMGRIAPTHQVRSDYMIRNWAQVKYSDAIYAVATIIDEGSKMNHGKIAKISQVKGGTGYAVQMAINEGKPVYIYDGTKNSWFTWDGTTFSRTNTPTLTKNFAGIGSRSLSSTEVWKKSDQAIRDVYELTQTSLETTQPAAEVTPIELENVQKIKFPKFTDDFQVEFTDKEGKEHRVLLNTDISGAAYFELATKQENGSYKPERDSKGKTKNRKETDTFVRENLPKELVDSLLAYKNLDSNQRQVFENHLLGIPLRGMQEFDFFTPAKDIKQLAEEFTKLPDNVKLLEKYLASFKQAALNEKIKNTEKSIQEGQKRNNLKTVEKQKVLLEDFKKALAELSKEAQPTAEVIPTPEVKKDSTFTYDGITLKTEFPLGEQQEVALKELINFALDPNPSMLAWTLEGYAGTGKTSIIALVEQYLKKAQPGSKFAYIAPTHAATVALGLNTIKYGNKDLPATLASSMYLKKVKGVPVPTLTKKIMDRLQGYNRYIVIDEASMLKKGEVEQILAAAAQQGIKLILQEILNKYLELLLEI